MRATLVVTLGLWQIGLISLPGAASILGVVGFLGMCWTVRRLRSLAVELQRVSNKQDEVVTAQEAEVVGQTEAIRSLTDKHEAKVRGD